MIDATVQGRTRGVLTLPAELRQKYGIEEGDVSRLVDLDGVFDHTYGANGARVSAKSNGSD